MRQSRSMSTLWQEEEFEQICSKELLTEKAADIEKTIAVKEHERERYDEDFRPASSVLLGLRCGP